MNLFLFWNRCCCCLLLLLTVIFSDFLSTFFSAFTHRYVEDLPARAQAVDYAISTQDDWNYALLSAGPDADANTAAASSFPFLPSTPAENWLAFDSQASKGWTPSFAFDDSGEYPFSVVVQGRTLEEWTYWSGSKITGNVPPSPYNKTNGLGEIKTLRLVPFGSTNIRISVFPWILDNGVQNNVQNKVVVTSTNSCEKIDGDCPQCSHPWLAGQNPVAKILLSNETKLVASAKMIDQVLTKIDQGQGHVQSFDHPDTGLHTSMFYFCCHSSKEIEIMKNAMRNMSWSSFDVSYVIFFLLFLPINHR